MPIELTIRVISPLSPDDHELLSGVAVMTLAIANHEMAKARFPETFQDDDEATQEAAPAPCGYVDPVNRTTMCVGEVGHRGRHKFRAIPADVDASMSRVN
jgi:hypothetical protein